MGYKSATVFLLVLGLTGSVIASPDGSDRRKAEKRYDRNMEKQTLRAEKRHLERSEKRLSRDDRAEKRYSAREKYERRTVAKERSGVRIIGGLPNKSVRAAPGTVVDTRTKVVRHYSKPRHRVTLPPHRRPGYVIRRIPSAAFTLTLGGIAYFYVDGLFYHHYPHGYVVVRPPIGAIVPALPLGYLIVTLHGTNYYYHEHTYYVWDRRASGYRVVEEPADTDDTLSVDEVALYMPGNIVEHLPDGAESIMIGGVQYYEYKRIYFMPSVQNGVVVYIVVNLAE